MDLRKKNLDVTLAGPSTSSDKSGRNMFPNNPLPDNKEQIEEIICIIAGCKGQHDENAFMSRAKGVTRTHYLLLRKLQALSETKLNRITVLIYLLKYIDALFDTLQSNYSKKYIKVKVLDIIRQNTEKLVNNGEQYIEELSHNVCFAKFIFKSFAQCDNKVAIQKTLFQFLTVIANHIKKSRNNVSHWEYHLMHCNYFFGNNVICLLENSVGDDGMLSAAITLLELLSQKISVKIDFVTRLFELNNLVSTVIKCFWKYYNSIKKESTGIVFLSPKWLEFITKWQMLIININERNSFLLKCPEITNLSLNNICILRIVNIILCYSKDIFCKNRRHCLSTRLIDAEHYPAFCKCLLILRSFPSTLYTPQFDRCIITLLQYHKQYLLFKNKQTITQGMSEEQSNANNEDLKSVQDNINLMKEYLKEKLKYWNLNSLINLLLLPPEVVDNDYSTVDDILQELVEKHKTLKSNFNYIPLRCFRPSIYSTS